MDQENIFTPHSPLSGLVVLKDSLDADGNFLVSYTLRHALQEGYKVVLVCLANTVNHYHSVLRKLGTNLQASRERRQVAIVEALSSGWLRQASASADAAEHLISSISREAEELQGEAPAARICVIIDTLTAVRDLCAREQLWRVFVHRCCSPNNFSQGITCLAVLVHDVEGDAQWCIYLEHAAQCIVELSALEHGHFQEIAGKVSVVHRFPAALTTTALDHSMKRDLYYKLSEGGVRLFRASTARVWS